MIQVVLDVAVEGLDSRPISASVVIHQSPLIVIHLDGGLHQFHQRQISMTGLRIAVHRFQEVLVSLLCLPPLQIGLADQVLEPGPLIVLLRFGEKGFIPGDGFIVISRVQISVS